MSEPEKTSPGPRPGTSEDVAKAVEFLFVMAIRCLFIGLSVVAGLLALAAWSLHWTRWVAIPSTVVAVGAFALGMACRPAGRLGSDRHGPFVVVPRRVPPVESIGDVGAEIRVDDSR